jgi:D-sedoheptulose 7-phosphate isomerase
MAAERHLSGPGGFYDEYFAELEQRLRDASPDQLEDVCQMLMRTRGFGGKVLLAGNGASAAIASHVAVDLTKCAGIRATTFNDVDLITCFANDYGYEHWVAKAIDFYADSGDIVVLISSSGRSPNIVNAGVRTRERGIPLLTFSGFDANNPLRELGDLNLWVDSHRYNIVETTHQCWLLAAVDCLAAGAAL